nr:homeobox protein OTX-like [Leptinotarsa decemlineata]
MNKIDYQAVIKYLVLKGNTPRKSKVWFKNRRAKCRTTNKTSNHVIARRTTTAPRKVRVSKPSPEVVQADPPSPSEVPPPKIPPPEMTVKKEPSQVQIYNGTDFNNLPLSSPSISSSGHGSYNYNGCNRYPVNSYGYVHPQRYHPSHQQHLDYFRSQYNHNQVQAGYHNGAHISTYMGEIPAPPVGSHGHNRTNCNMNGAECNMNGHVASYPFSQYPQYPQYRPMTALNQEDEIEHTQHLLCDNNFVNLLLYVLVVEENPMTLYLSLV